MGFRRRQGRALPAVQRHVPMASRPRCGRVTVDLQLDGRRALVTGGSRGLGFAIASELGAEGVRIALLARDADAVEAAAAELLALGYDAMGVVADTNRGEQVEAAVATVAERFGGIDILVNGAAKAGGGPTTGLMDLD